MVNKKLFPPFFSFPFLIKGVSAHCPLCTAGAAIAAGGGAYLGVPKAIIGLFIGAFAASTGWWVSRLVKKKYIHFQKTIIILTSFLLTVIPLLPIIKDLHPFYLSLFGDYGSLLNRTYMVDFSLLTSILGGTIVSITPFLSKRISRLRDGRVYPFQGVLLTLVSLILVGVLLGFIL